MADHPDAGWAGRLAVAIVRSDPPSVFLASNHEDLGRVLALQLVAQTSPASLRPDQLRRIRSALLEEQWADALALWIEATGEMVDAYPDEDVWTRDRLEREFADFEMRLAPLFRGNTSE
jgi:hypothetical protein